MKRFFLFCFLLLAGCSYLVAKPEVEVKRVTLAGIDGKGVVLDFLLSVTNRNSYTLRLNGFRYDLRVADLPLARGEGREPLEFKGNSATEVKVPVQIAFQDLLEILKRHPDPEHIPYRLTAAFDLKAPLAIVKVPVEKSGSFAVPQNCRPDRFLRKFNDLIKK
ncbi:MAG TPA: LEA type 2 family protein [Geobacteraceae bacterium]